MSSLVIMAGEALRLRRSLEGTCKAWQDRIVPARLGLDRSGWERTCQVRQVRIAGVCSFADKNGMAGKAGYGLDGAELGRMERQDRYGMAGTDSPGREELGAKR